MRLLIYKKNNVIGASGGAEKVMINLANEMNRRGHEVFFVTRDNKKGVPFYPLDKEIEFLNIAKPFAKWRRVVGKSLEIAKVIRFFPSFNREKMIADSFKFICSQIKPDVIVATGISDLVDITYGQTYDVPLMITLHNPPHIIFDLPYLKKKHALAAMKKVQLAMVLLPSFKQSLKNYYQGPTVAIGNVIKPTNRIRDYQLEHRKIVNVARFDPKQKRQDILIRAFARIASEFPDWSLEFWGSSKNKKYMEMCRGLIHKNELSQQISFKGVTDNPDEIYFNSDILALPSAFEGFCLVLTEAMATGMVCIGFKDCPCVNELITNGVSGFLADDEEDFAKKMKLLASDSKLREKLGRNALKIAEQYSPEKIWNQWENVLKELVEKGY